MFAKNHKKQIPNPNKSEALKYKYVLPYLKHLFI